MNPTSEPATDRQVLYALVSGGFIVVVGVLVLGAAFAELVPVWWTATGSAATIGIAALAALRWRETRVVLLSSILLFFVWVVGTLLVS